MVSLAKAVPGVVNAFIIQLIIMCIYAMLSVEFFRTYGAGHEFINERGNVVELSTSRGQTYGWEYFGNFPKALYTMFQVLTGESWSEAIARPLVHGSDDLQSVLFGLFFVSFCVLNGVVLINVVVAVLLEKMVDDEVSPEQLAREAQEEAEQKEYEEKMPKLAKVVDGLKGDISTTQKQIKLVFDLLQARKPGPNIIAPTTGWSDPQKPRAMVVEEIQGDDAVELPGQISN